MTDKIKVAVAKGDGIGPEIMDAVLSIFDAAGVRLAYEFVSMGKAAIDAGHPNGIDPEAEKAIESLGILFKGPMETPKGKGIRSINVTARKTWNTFANIRRFQTIKGVDTVFSRAGIPIDITVMRENIEGTYGGVEYMHTPDAAVSYRFITRPGSAQFIRYCFEYAKQAGIRKITCSHKANIMKLSDGLFMNTFYEIAKEHPEFEINDLIVDDLAMKLVRQPDKFEMIVLTNLQGDIMSDLCAGLVGGLGFAPSANIGDKISIFEAVHGTAPDIAGKNIANPTSLLLSGTLLLKHLGMNGHADNIENAWLKTIEEGSHTGDFGDPRQGLKSTTEFTQQIIENLGQHAEGTVRKSAGSAVNFKRPEMPKEMRVMPSIETHQFDGIAGVDIYIVTAEQPASIAAKIQPILDAEIELAAIGNRGTEVWPEGSRFTEAVAYFSIRLQSKNEMTVAGWLKIIGPISQLFSISNIEILHTLQGQPAFSKL